MDPGPYQVRYAWDRRIWTVVCSAAAVILIVAVEVWQQILPSGALVPQLGVRRRQDETPQLTTRAVTGFQLDRRALARTVAQYAPHVGVLDADTGREITADG